jgi:hypothetical protein
MEQTHKRYRQEVRAGKQMDRDISDADRKSSR